MVPSLRHDHREWLPVRRPRKPHARAPVALPEQAWAGVRLEDPRSRSGIERDPGGDEARQRTVHAPPDHALLAAQPEHWGALELRSALPTGRPTHRARLAAGVCRPQPEGSE